MPDSLNQGLSQSPGTISVTVEVEREVFASRGAMDVEISGDSVVWGDSAKSKAHEVRDLVSALALVGVDSGSVQVVSVRASVSGGIVGKSSSATYKLRIEVPVDLLPDAVGAVTSRKSATLHGIQWLYDGLNELHTSMLGDALRLAQERAALICSVLDHDNLGVSSSSEKILNFSPREVGPALSTDRALALARDRAVTQADLGLDVSHAQTVRLELRVSYFVRPRSSAGHPRHDT